MKVLQGGVGLSESLSYRLTGIIAPIRIPASGRVLMCLLGASGDLVSSYFIDSQVS